MLGLRMKLYPDEFWKWFKEQGQEFAPDSTVGKRGRFFIKYAAIKKERPSSIR